MVIRRLEISLIFVENWRVFFIKGNREDDEGNVERVLRSGVGVLCVFNCLSSA